MKNALAFLSRWLEPADRACLLCGRRGAGKAHQPVPVRHPQAASILRMLCSACRASIPWIHRPVCAICGRPEACPDCPRRAERRVVFSRCAVRYDSRMRDLLALYKYRGSERLEPLMAAMLCYAYERICSELAARAAAPRFHAVLSVPLAQERLEERGFNQAERMARLLAEWHDLPHWPVLERNRHTEKQSLKSRRSRLLDMKGTFSADPAPLIRLLRVQPHGPIRLLLVDDIYTTGSTLNECATAVQAAMQSGGASCGRLEIYGLLWARS